MAARRLPGDDLPRPVRRHHLQGPYAGERDLRSRLPYVDDRGCSWSAGPSNERKGPRRRLTPVEIAMLVFGGLALLSIVLNIDRIYQQNELSFVNKQLSQLIAYGAFFFVVIASIRPEEVPAFYPLGDGPRLHHRGGRHLRIAQRRQPFLLAVRDAAGSVRAGRRRADRQREGDRQWTHRARRSLWRAC